MKRKIMFILALLGFTALHTDAQQCARPVKKAKAKHASCCRVATVKKSKPIRTAMVKKPATLPIVVNTNPAPLCMAPATGRCLVSADGDITHCFAGTGANGNLLTAPTHRIVVRNSDQIRTSCLSMDRRFAMACESPGTVVVEVNNNIDYSLCAPGTCTIPLAAAPICTTPNANTHCFLDNNGQMACASTNTWSGFYPSESLNPGLNPRFGNSLVISSSAFHNNGALPAKYTCEGQQVTPPLTVENVPEGTQTLAVILYDPKATATQSNTYWMAWNITSSFIPENFRGDYMARNPYSKFYGYTAICPVNGDHNYHFRVFALDKRISLSKDANRAMFEDAISGHVLASGEIVGTYARMR